MDSVRRHTIDSARQHVTPFQLRVYEAVSAIPKGEVATYGEIARRIGCKSAQAVGQALRRNPFAPVVPCHRVVAADGSLCGFYGRREGADDLASLREMKRKRHLLEEEGVVFTPEGRVSMSCRGVGGTRPEAACQRQGMMMKS